MSIFVGYAFMQTKTVNALTFNKKDELISLSEPKTYNLFSSSSINDYFTFEGVAEYYNESTGTEIIYRSESICVGSAKYNAEYYALFKMSDSLYSLAKNGLVNITAYANFYSPINSKVSGDSPEKITMNLASATSIKDNISGKYVIGNVEYGSFSKSVSNQQKSYATNDYALTLEGVTDRYLVLRFTSEYASAGIKSTCNYMNVRKPRIEVSYKKFSVNYNYGVTNTTASYGTKITVDVPQKNGYEINKCLVNNSEVEVVDNKISFVVNKNTNVEFKYRKILTLNVNESYFYNDGNSINLEYLCDENISSIKFKYFYNGEEVDEINNLGDYKVVYSYVDDNYILNGEAPIRVLPVPYEIKLNDKTFVYNGEKQILSIYNPRNFNLNVIFTQNGIECHPINAGIYDYTVSVQEYGYYGQISGKIEIEKQKVNIENNNFNNSFIYDGNAHYNEVESEYNCIITYLKDGVITQPINAGDYVCNIEIDEINYEGSLTFDFAILPREVRFSVNNYESIYGEDFKEIIILTHNGLEGVDYGVSYSSDLSKKVGVYQIKINELENDANYKFVYENGYYEVTKRKLIVTPESGQHKYFGDPEKKLNYTVTGLLEGDVLVGEISREGGENAGNYLFVVGSLFNENYEIEIINEYFVIYPQRMIVVAKSYQKVYGEDDPKVFEYEIISSTISNYQLNGRLERVEGENVGVYNIGLGTLKDPNINIVLVQGQLEILPKNVDVFANATFKYFGDQDSLSFTTNGLNEGDLLQGSLSRECGENVGEYEIQIGTLKNSNYNITFYSNVFKILPKGLNLCANEVEKVYGDLDPELTYYANEEFDNNQIFGKLNRIQGENVGEYKIVMGSLNSENYNIIFEESIFKISPRNCLVYNNYQSKIYGENDPVFDYKIFGVINNDLVNVEVTREIGENCGLYRYIIDDNDSNYNFRFANERCFEILKADKEIIVKNYEFYYSGEIFEPNEYISIDYEYCYSLNGKDVCEIKDAGEYDYYIKFSGDGNYNPSVSDTAKITIKKLVLPITITYTSFIYDGKVHEPIYISNSDDLDLSVEFGDLTPEAVGSHDFKIISTNKNYEELSGVINILPAQANNELSGVTMQLIGGNVAHNNKDNIKFSVSSVNNSSSIYELDVSNQKIIKAFKTDFNNVVDASKFTVKIDSIDLENEDQIHIFAIDSANNLIEIKYQIKDGIISFETDNANLSYIITSYSKTYISVYQIIIIVAILVFSLYLHFISRKFIKKVKVKKIKRTK